MEKFDHFQTPQDQVRLISRTRKCALLLIFCLAMFLDSFNLSALFAAIPVLKNQFHLAENESIWVISGFQLTYASFLLIVSFQHDFLLSIHSHLSLLHRVVDYVMCIHQVLTLKFLILQTSHRTFLRARLCSRNLLFGLFEPGLWFCPERRRPHCSSSVLWYLYVCITFLEETAYH